MARVALALIPACWLFSGYAQAQPAEPAPPASNEPAPAQPPAAPAPAPGASSAAPPTSPPPQYYIEPRAPSGRSGPVQPQTAPAQPQTAPAQRAMPPRTAVYEPPPPGYYPTVYEPPPPPKPQHIAPKYSFWLGARVGWFIPFGDLWAHTTDGGRSYDGIGWSDYASSGPMFEADIGARLGRYYNLFLAWERAQLGTGSADPDGHGGQETGESDYYAIGLRVSSDADKVGFLTEIDLGYRRFRARWSDGTELQLTNAPLEFRIGLGADIRLGPLFSLSPMATLGVGAFGTAEWKDTNGDTRDATEPDDQSAGHGWFTLQLGGHFDIAGGG